MNGFLTVAKFPKEPTKRQMARMRQKLVRERKWILYCLTFPKPEMMRAFLDLASSGGMEGDEYWDTLAGVWREIDNLWQYKWAFPRMFSYEWGPHDAFMTAEDREFLASLPETLTIYRACRKGVDEHGPSWTLDKGYANRLMGWMRRDLLRERTVSKAKVFAALNDNEQEIIIFDELEQYLREGKTQE
jgi:hypothetical protein